VTLHIIVSRMVLNKNRNGVAQTTNICTYPASVNFKLIIIAARHPCAYSDFVGPSIEKLMYNYIVSV